MPNVMVIIDPQNDFHPGGSLGIPGANEDSERISQFIEDIGDKIDEIYVTLDSHHRLHIAHGVCWKNEAGENPPPFTLITNKEVEDGIWTTVDPGLLEYAKYYTKALEAKGRFTMCIWPEHCLIGTPGHAVVPCLNVALSNWVTKKLKTINYIMKGTNCMTEMYSALAAEIPIPDDPSTCIDPILVTKLNLADQVLICGEAKSHCVNYTMRDILENWKSDPSKLILLDDCTTAVPGFESDAEKFVSAMKEASCQVVNAADYKFPDY
jgi:nicotinamidase/pyrazinamidase